MQNLLQGLQAGVLLKKTTTRESAVAALPAAICKDEASYQQLMQDTFIEKYFDAVAEISFPSRFVALSREAAVALQVCDSFQAGSLHPPCRRESE